MRLGSEAALLGTSALFHLLGCKYTPRQASEHMVTRSSVGGLLSQF